jgi:hypothetical protein
VKHTPFRLSLIFGIAALLAARGFPQVRSIELPGDNAMAELKPGPGVDVVRAQCIACHSTDYIVRQPRSDAKRWEGEVKKMIGVYGAPIDEADAKVIVNYLAVVYGEKAKKSGMWLNSHGVTTSGLYYPRGVLPNCCKPRVSASPFWGRLWVETTVAVR